MKIVNGNIKATLIGDNLEITIHTKQAEFADNNSLEDVARLFGELGGSFKGADLDSATLEFELTTTEQTEEPEEQIEEQHIEKN